VSALLTLSQSAQLQQSSKLQ